MTKIKLTNSKALEMVLGLEEVKGNKELFEKIQTLKTQIDKKNHGGKDGEKKATKTQKENKELAEKILLILNNIGNEMTITEIQESSKELEGLSNQKVSAILRQLVKSEKVLRLAIRLLGNLREIIIEAYIPDTVQPVNVLNVVNVLMYVQV